jgi:hypothetical protein
MCKKSLLCMALVLFCGSAFAMEKRGRASEVQNTRPLQRRRVDIEGSYFYRMACWFDRISKDSSLTIEEKYRRLSEIQEEGKTILSRLFERLIRVCEKEGKGDFFKSCRLYYVHCYKIFGEISSQYYLKSEAEMKAEEALEKKIV